MIRSKKIPKRIKKLCKKYRVRITTNNGNYKSKQVIMKQLKKAMRSSRFGNCGCKNKFGFGSASKIRKLYKLCKLYGVPIKNRKPVQLSKLCLKRAKMVLGKIKKQKFKFGLSIGGLLTGGSKEKENEAAQAQLDAKIKLTRMKEIESLKLQGDNTNKIPLAQLEFEKEKFRSQMRLEEMKLQGERNCAEQAAKKAQEEARKKQKEAEEASKRAEEEVKKKEKEAQEAAKLAAKQIEKKDIAVENHKQYVADSDDFNSQFGRRRGFGKHHFGKRYFGKHRFGKHLFGLEQVAKEPEKLSIWQRIKNNKGKIAAGVLAAGAVGLAAKKGGMFSKPPVMATKDIITTDAKAMKQAGSSASNEKQKQKQDELKQKQREKEAKSKAKKEVIGKVMINQLPEAQKKQALDKQEERRKVVEQKDEAPTYYEGFSPVFFGRRRGFGKRSRFGKNIFGKHRFGLEQLTKKESVLKRGLFSALKNTGLKIGDYADYTLKQVLKLCIKYLGPLVLASLLYRYRAKVSNLMFSKQDRDKINKATQSIQGKIKFPSVPR